MQTQLSDSFHIQGDIRLIRRNELTGQVNLDECHNNLVVTSGKQLLASRLFSDTRPAVSLLGITGNGTIATATFNVQSSNIYPVGVSVTIAGAVPAEFNGTYIVLSSTTSSIVFSSNVVASTTTHGQINSAYNSVISSMHIGTSGLASNLSNTSLWNDLPNSEGLSTTLSTTLDIADTASVVYIGYIPSSDPGNPTLTVYDIKEAGLFNSYGVMLSRTVFPTVPKNNQESLQIFWRITIA